MSDPEQRATIGILCKPNKPVFTTAAEQLRDAGHEVRFFHPRNGLTLREASDISLIVNKKTLPVALPTLLQARWGGTPLWNNMEATVLFSSRLFGLQAVSEAGLLTPEFTLEKPQYEYVAKGYTVWDDEPELNGDGDFYQELVPTEPVDFKYYAVRDGHETHVAGRRVTSKLYGEKQYLGEIEIDPAIAASLRRLVERFGLRGVGVDLVEAEDGQYYAVDVNLAAGYRDCGLESAIAASIASSLPAE
jgi:hypothetical protein